MANSCKLMCSKLFHTIYISTASSVAYIFTVAITSWYWFSCIWCKIIFYWISVNNMTVKL